MRTGALDWTEGHIPSSGYFFGSDGETRERKGSRYFNYSVQELDRTGQGKGTSTVIRKPPLWWK